MATRKQQKPPAEATKPAFVVADADHTDFHGLSKIEAFAAVIAMGIYAGPSGRVILNSTDDAMLERVAETAFHQGAVMAAHGARVLASLGARAS
jgi:cephalosporin hydroxylase